MRYKEILKLKYPKLPVIRISDTYEEIVWHTGFAQPTKQELDDAIEQYRQRSVEISDTGTVSLKTTGVVAGQYCKVTVDELGRVVLGQPLTLTDVVTALGFTPAAESGQVNILSTYTGSTGFMSGTSVIPADNTMPLITEGTELWTCAITPKNAQSKFILDQSFSIASSSNTRNVTLALFRGSECLYVNSVSLANANKTTTANIHVVDAPNSTEAFVYSLRVGVSSSATWSVNAASSTTNTFGGVANASDWSILEIN